MRGLLTPRLERAIGVIYRPDTELASHYFEAVLPRQFDEYIWFDETKAVTPLANQRPGRPAGHLSVRAVAAQRRGACAGRAFAAMRRVMVKRRGTIWSNPARPV